MDACNYGGHDNFDNLLDEVVQRVVDAVSPLRILLFGSAVRGSQQPDSDLDLLVVMPSGSHRRQAAQRIYRALLGVGYAIDVVVVTEEDLHRHADDPGMIIGAALEEGRELYAA